MRNIFRKLAAATAFFSSNATCCNSLCNESRHLTAITITDFESLAQGQVCKRFTGNILQDCVLVTCLYSVCLRHRRKAFWRIKRNLKCSICCIKGYWRQTGQFNCRHNFLKTCPTFLTNVITPEFISELFVPGYRICSNKDLSENNLTILAVR